MKLLALVASLLTFQTLAPAQADRPAAHPIPSIIEQEGRYALMVDGAPFLILGMQANNSSAWPAYFDKVFPAAEQLRANTVEVPVYWEQMEATEGRYDFSVVDGMLAQARGHHVRLVLLWFGTWKNGSSHYTPQWMKLDQDKYPFLLNKDGETVDSPSTYSHARLDADKNAFAALMRHLREADTQRTVIMVQVENEPGVWGGTRDYRPDAEKDISGQVPQGLVDALMVKAGTWQDTFGDAAEDKFQAWCIASYIEQVAAAGKTEYPLPIYVNAALRDPATQMKPGTYESGAPTDQNLQLYRTVAPSLAVIAPDIYMPEYAKYTAVMNEYKRFSNPLLIPETGNSPTYARYVFAAIGQGAIGWAPFGLDLTEYSNQTEGPEAMGDKTAKGPDKRLAPFANEYALLAPIARKLAAANLEGALRGASEDPDSHTQTLDFPRWQVQLSYGLPAFGNWMKPKGNTPPDGGAVLVALGPDEFLVAGHHVRVDFTPTFEKSKKRLFLEVVEGSYDASGKWNSSRVWNGDQTDYGLNFRAEGNTLLRVKLTTY